MQSLSAPNVVYILADDMGVGDVSCLNPNGKIHTRHIDAVAAQGVAFNDAHSSSAVCTPTRYSVLTGRYNWRSSMKEGVTWSWSRHLIEDDRTTVAAYLQTKGYHTACIGKWHLGWDWPLNSDDESDVDYSRPITFGPTHFGFDYFYGIPASLDIPPYVYIENDRPTSLPDRQTEDKSKQGWWRLGPTGADFRHEEVLPNLTRKACTYIAEQAKKEQPFFLYFPLPAPHTPMLPTPEFQGKSGLNTYGDFCLMVDDVVGQISEALAQNGISDNTILIFTSDNGCSPEADFLELAQYGHMPSHVYRGSKADIYDGGHRVPFVMRWPAEVHGGSRISTETICLNDLFATMAEILGDTLSDNVAEDSVSNLAVWKGESLDKTVREATVHHSCDGSFAIRKGKWKLVLCSYSGGWCWPRKEQVKPGMPEMQLYDMEIGYRERCNIIDQHPEIVEELKALLTRYIREGRSTPGERQPNTGPRHWPQLNWLSEQDLV